MQLDKSTSRASPSYLLNTYLSLNLIALTITLLNNTYIFHVSLDTIRSFLPYHQCVLQENKVLFNMHEKHTLILFFTSSNGSLAFALNSMSPLHLSTVNFSTLYMRIGIYCLTVSSSFTFSIRVSNVLERVSFSLQSGVVGRNVNLQSSFDAFSLHPISSYSVPSLASVPRSLLIASGSDSLVDALAVLLSTIEKKIYF